MSRSDDAAQTLPRAETVQKPFVHRARRFLSRLNPLPALGRLGTARYAFAFLLAFVALLAFGRSADAPRRIDHVVKASVVSDDTAVLLVRTPETGAIHARRINPHDSIVVYEDAAKDQEAWAEYVGESLGCMPLRERSLVLHVHSRAEIELPAQRE